MTTVTMTPRQRKYVFVQGGVGAAIINLLLNGGIGWVITTGLSEFPMWSMPGVLPDLAATAFGVAFGTAIGVSFQVRSDLAKGKIDSFEPPANVATLLDRFPEKVFPRSIWAGFVSLVVFATPVLVVATATGEPSLQRNTFILVKALFSAVEAAVVTPLLVIAALRGRTATSQVRV